MTVVSSPPARTTEQPHLLDQAVERHVCHLPRKIMKGSFEIMCYETLDLDPPPSLASTNVGLFFAAWRLAKLLHVLLGAGRETGCLLLQVPTVPAPSAMPHHLDKRINVDLACKDIPRQRVRTIVWLPTLVPSATPHTNCRRRRLLPARCRGACTRPCVRRARPRAGSRRSNRIAACSARRP